ncbi:hypothetical protein ACFL38_02945 [Candidatus Omnitrophota bacterium]
MNKSITELKSSHPFKRPVVAYGADVKNTFCVAKGRSLFLSKNHGDLEQIENFARYTHDMQRLQKRFAKHPKIIAYDMHPEYQSTKYALRQLQDDRHCIGVAVQHHHAHIAACMWNNNVRSSVIGISFDGTGFGLDGAVWGGEFFMGNLKDFKRAAHLRYIPMPGGSQAIQEPWRMSLAWLYSLYKHKLWELNIDFVKRLDKKKGRLITQMIEKDINCPLTSSMGRLFDAVSALIGIRGVVAYEAQAAIELEKKAQKSKQSKQKAYPYTIQHCDSLVIDPQPLFKAVIKDLQARVTQEDIAWKFHYTIASIIRDVSMSLRKRSALKKVVLSGGVFQNNLLKQLVRPLLVQEGFSVYIHRDIPTSDAGISIGQAMIAHSRARKR